MRITRNDVGKCPLMLQLSDKNVVSKGHEESIFFIRKLNSYYKHSSWISALRNICYPTINNIMLLNKRLRS